MRLIGMGPNPPPVLSVREPPMSGLILTGKRRCALTRCKGTEEKQLAMSKV